MKQLVPARKGGGDGGRNETAEDQADVVVGACKRQRSTR